MRSGGLVAPPVYGGVGGLDQPHTFIIEPENDVHSVILRAWLEKLGREAQRQGFRAVIFLTGHGDVPLAVATLKKGAFDFFEKPFNDNDLATSVREAMDLDARQRAASATVDSVNSRLSTLTARERQIMELVLLGKFNKVIADELNISMRTVEVHRANLFDKMKVKTAVELANLLKPNR